MVSPAQHVTYLLASTCWNALPCARSIIQHHAENTNTEDKRIGCSRDAILGRVAAGQALLLIPRGNMFSPIIHHHNSPIPVFCSFPATPSHTHSMHTPTEFTASTSNNHHHTSHHEVRCVAGHLCCCAVVCVCCCSRGFALLCSKIDRELLAACVHKVVAFSKGESIQVGDETKKGKVRGFLETIELQTTIKNFDPSKDKRFSGNIELPNAPRPNLRLCVIGNEAHYTTAKELGLPAMNVEDLKKFNKNKKLVKRMAKKYHGFLASWNLIKQIPRYLGPTLQRVKKFPAMLTKSDDLEAKVKSMKSTVAIKMKKVLCISFGVANVGMEEEDIIDNILKTVNFLVSLPKKNWQNIKCLYIKSTMGPSFCIYA